MNQNKTAQVPVRREKDQGSIVLQAINDVFVKLGEINDVITTLHDRMSPYIINGANNDVVIDKTMIDCPENNDSALMVELHRMHECAHAIKYRLTSILGNTQL